MEHITVKEITEAAGGRLLAGDPSALVTEISIDSREAGKGCLFVPLIGEKNDAHRFIMTALDQGTAAVFTSEHEETSEEVKESRQRWPEAAWIQVEDTRKALQSLGAFIRRRLTLPLVGITGSVGKTTTREMVAAALSAGYRVFKTPANHNSQIGVPLTLSKISREDQIGVLELGMSEPGEMEVIAEIAAVDMAVITNVGVTHIENLGSRENILREKLNIQRGMNPSGPIFLNSDNDLLCRVSGWDGRETVYFGTGEQADYRAADISMENGCPSFTMVHGDVRIPVTLSVMGEHNILNALAALAVADRNGVSLEAAAEKLREFGGFKNRQQVYEAAGVTIIDDTYNASPDSMKAGIKVLSSFETSRRRVAVLADMKELGLEAVRFHEEIGAYIGEHPLDMVLLLGELASCIGSGMDAARAVTPYIEMDRLAQVEEWLDEHIREGDCILFKGSNSMKLSEAVRHLKEARA